jgi:transcriptional regulator with XRE-family HTH domain
MENPSMAKAAFAKKLRKLMDDRGMSQSDLARAAQKYLPDGRLFRRDNISVYVNERALPRPKQLNAIAKALRVDPNDLLPETDRNGVSVPYSIQPVPGEPGQSHLLVNMKVPMRTAISILALLDKSA